MDVPSSSSGEEGALTGLNALLISFDMENERAFQLGGVWQAGGLDYYSEMNQRRQETTGLLFLSLATLSSA